MECNKEEAIRAKGIAENKMQIRDFVGARKLLLKALHLFPDMENASQMLTVCEVHCSADSLVNGQTDHYGVLLVLKLRLSRLEKPIRYYLIKQAAKFMIQKRRVHMRTVSSWNPSQHVNNANSKLEFMR